MTTEVEAVEERVLTPWEVALSFKNGKNYEFYRYDGAGHGFFYWDRPLYRVEQAMDGWDKVWTFFGKHLTA